MAFKRSSVRSRSAPPNLIYQQLLDPNVNLVPHYGLLFSFYLILSGGAFCETLKSVEPSFWPGHLLKIEAQPNTEESEQEQISISLFKKSANGIQLINKISLGNRGLNTEYAFDLAGYRMSEKERAIGIRSTETDYGSERYNHEVTRLKLLRMTPQGLVEIFDEVMHETDQLWMKGDTKITTVEDENHHSVLVVSSRKHHGCFDLILKTTSKKLTKPFDSYYEGESDNRVKKNEVPNYKASTTKRTFIWNTKKYVVEKA